MKLQNSENMVVLGSFLGITAVVAASVLAIVSMYTQQPIRQAQEKNRQKAFHRLLLPDFDTVGRSVDAGGCSFTPVLQDGVICGYVGQSSSRGGYGGEIEALVGFDVRGRITAVQILRHKETPGLGANVCDRKFQRTVFNLRESAPEVPANAFLDQFSSRDSRSAGRWRISKDGGEFDYLTGATVTSRAVTGLVDRISAAFAGSGLGKSEGDKR